MIKENHALDLFIAKFLRYGVVLAGLLLAVGWLGEISFTTNVFEKFHTYHDSPIDSTFRSLVRQQRWALLSSYLGLIVLISLPIVRVLMTMLVFLKNRDYALASVAGFVLAGLVLSILLGFDM